VPVKAASKVCSRVCLRPSSGLWDCKHQPVRVTAVPLTINRNPAVPGISHAGTTPLLLVVLVFSFYVCHPSGGEEKSKQP